MKNIVHRTFLEHPESVDETFFQHFLFAVKFSGTLFVAASAAMVHAFIPCLCEKTASTKISELYNRMHNRFG